MDIATATIPEFRPHTFFDGLGEFYDDGRVLAAIDTVEVDGEKTLVISEFTSRYPSNGHATEALQWLRDQGFQPIVANGVGTIDDGVGDIATEFWMHMHSKGLVDILVDDNGADITPAQKPKMRP